MLHATQNNAKEKNNLLAENVDHHNKKENVAMSKVYFTITGTKYFMGSDFLEPGMKVKLKKEPDNKYDKEAILVTFKGMDIGHVANSTHTVIGNCMSAGRIYDKIGDTAKGKVMFVTPSGVVCKLSMKSVK